MNVHPKWKELQQRRTIEAAKNNYLGPAGKFGVIARYLGDIIVSNDGGMIDVRHIDLDPYEVVPEDHIPIAEEVSGEDYEERIRGVVFSGLSRGMHLEIKYLRQTADLTVHYKGYLVYQEVAGDLYAYNPFPEWESMIEKLYVVAQKKQEAHKTQMVEQYTQEAEQERRSILTQLKMLWGELF